MAETLSTLNLKDWIAENRHLLKPPVGNAQVWKGSEFIVMVVGGPNSRKDYHLDPAPEFFYQLEGDMLLRVIEKGKPRDIPIREGEIFLLPPMVPHSPQRFPNTVGLVIERSRRPKEIDHLRWYCEGCWETLYDETFRLTDITTQLKPIMERFFGDRKLRTCKKCGAVMDAPQAARK